MAEDRFCQDCGQKLTLMNTVNQIGYKERAKEGIFRCSKCQKKIATNEINEKYNQRREEIGNKYTEIDKKYNEKIEEINNKYAPNKEIVSELKGGVLKSYDENIGDDQVLVRLPGIPGFALVATDKRVMIITAGFSSGAMMGQKCKSYEYSDISSIECSCGMTQGRVQLTVAGSLEVRQPGLGNAYQAENIVHFSSSEKDIFQQATNLIRQEISKAKRGNIFVQQSQADDIPTQIKKLAELKDLGILSNDEFEAKKKDLLSKM